MIVVHMYRLATYWGTVRDERPEGGSSENGSNHREIRAMEKEREADNGRHKHSPLKKRNGGMPVREQRGM
jgi:hypothetical protein